MTCQSSERDEQGPRRSRDTPERRTCQAGNATSRERDKQGTRQAGNALEVNSKCAGELSHSPIKISRPMETQYRDSLPDDVRSAFDKSVEALPPEHHPAPVTGDSSPEDALRWFQDPRVRSCHFQQGTRSSSGMAQD